MKSILILIFLIIINLPCLAQKVEIIKELKPLSIRGTNYYPADTPWADMWTEKTDTKVFYEDMAKAKELNINAVRTFIFFDVERGFVKEDGSVSNAYFKKFDAFLDAAWENGIRVIPCFEAPYKYPESAWKKQMKDFAQKYKDDGRILMWDLVNEPGGSVGGPLGDEKIADFIRKGMDYLKSIDKNHIVTVGLCFEIDQLLQITIPDTSHFHDYGAWADYEKMGVERIGSSIRLMREYLPNSPVLIGEFGWASKDISNDLGTADADEYHQLSRYGICLNSYEVYQTAGAMNWCLLDYPIPLWQDAQRFFGIIRSDGTLKPAGYLMKSFYSRWKQKDASYVFNDDFNSPLRWKEFTDCDIIEKLEDDSFFIQKNKIDGESHMSQTRKINFKNHRYLTVSVLDISSDTTAIVSLKTEDKEFDLIKITKPGIYTLDFSTIFNPLDNLKEITIIAKVNSKKDGFVTWDRISVSNVDELK